MADLDALLGGIVSEPLEETRWLVLADWLEENDDVRRGELLGLHRKLLATCCAPEAQPERKSRLNRVVNVSRGASATRRPHPDRKAWQARVVELIADGVRPCVPQETLQLPGGVSMTFSFIPPGSFLMGGTVSDDEKPIHKVTLTKGFFLGVHPVTQLQWAAVMGNNPRYFKGENRPVERVSWDDCQEFCEKLGSKQESGLKVGLPTEAEWEWACRAGTTTDYHFGVVLNTDLANYNELNWACGNPSPKGKYGDETTEVGLFPCNTWGLFDLHGNVWEWCQDVYDEDYYQSSPPQDPIGTTNQDDIHVFRGGSCNMHRGYCRAAARWWRGAKLSESFLGFRVCFRLD